MESAVQSVVPNPGRNLNNLAAWMPHSGRHEHTQESKQKGRVRSALQHDSYFTPCEQLYIDELSFAQARSV